MPFRRSWAILRGRFSAAAPRFRPPARRFPQTAICRQTAPICERRPISPGLSHAWFSLSSISPREANSGVTREGKRPHAKDAKGQRAQKEIPSKHASRAEKHHSSLRLFFLCDLCVRSSGQTHRSAPMPRRCRSGGIRNRRNAPGAPWAAACAGCGQWPTDRPAPRPVAAAARP